MSLFSDIPPINRKTFKFRGYKKKHQAMQAIPCTFHLTPETMRRIENYAKRQRIPKSHALEKMLAIEALHHVEPPVKIDWHKQIKMDSGEYYLSFDPTRKTNKRRKHR